MENPQLSPMEAGDCWLDRLSPSSPAKWELKDTLDASVPYCRQLATHLLRAGNKELSANFDAFAEQFDALRQKYFPRLNLGTDAKGAGVRRLDTSPPSIPPTIEEVGQSRLPRQAPESRKRGRPSTIPIDRKMAAVKCKAAGGTNKDIAALLYDTLYPSNQQKTNVPSILNHFARQLERPPGGPSKNKLESNNSKG